MMSPAAARIDLLTFIRVHPHQAAEAFLAAGALVEQQLAFGDGPLVDPHEGQLAVRIVHDLERHTDERPARVGVKFDRRVSAVSTCVNRPVERRGQIADDRVQQGLNSLIAIRGAQEDRRDILRSARNRATRYGSAAAALPLPKAAAP